MPLSAIHSLPVSVIQDKHVIDAVNYYPERDGPIEALESGETLSLIHIYGGIYPIVVAQALKPFPQATGRAAALQNTLQLATNKI